MNYSEFALYEARTDQRHFINWFSEENYIHEKDAYRNAQTFNRMITENQLTYHVQPTCIAFKNFSNRGNTTVGAVHSEKRT